MTGAPWFDKWPGPRSVPLRRDTPVVVLEKSVAFYDDQGRALVMLNESASAVWDLCDGASTYEQLVADLAARDAERLDEIRDDVWQTLHKLASLGLVTDATKAKDANDASAPTSPAS